MKERGKWNLGQDQGEKLGFMITQRSWPLGNSETRHARMEQGWIKDGCSCKNNATISLTSSVLAKMFSKFKTFQMKTTAAQCSQNSGLIPRPGCITLEWVYIKDNKQLLGIPAVFPPPAPPPLPYRPAPCIMEQSCRHANEWTIASYFSVYSCV